MGWFKSEEEKKLKRQPLDKSKDGKNLKEIRCKNTIPTKCKICGKENFYQMLAIEYKNLLWFTINFCSLNHLKSFLDSNNINFEIISKGYFYTTLKGIVVRIDKVKIDENIEIETKFFEVFIE